MIEYVFRPIEKWPREENARHRPALFTATYEETMRLLDDELQRAGAKGQVVIQAYVKLSDLRIDGRLRSESRPAKPGVILSFTGKHGAVKMPCDEFNHWKDNIRAIALSLEALRKVDRYGVTQNGEQYRGWTALPPPAGSQAMSGIEAADFITKHVDFIPASWILEKRDAFETAYKLAAKKLHPDVAGGTGEDFKTLQTAAEVLRRHHGVTE